jgi:hypothetical protein
MLCLWPPPPLPLSSPVAGSPRPAGSTRTPWRALPEARARPGVPCRKPRSPGSAPAGSPHSPWSALPEPRSPGSALPGAALAGECPAGSPSLAGECPAGNRARRGVPCRKRAGTFRDLSGPFSGAPRAGRLPVVNLWLPVVTLRDGSPPGESEGRRKRELPPERRYPGARGAWGRGPCG